MHALVYPGLSEKPVVTRFQDTYKIERRFMGATVHVLNPECPKRIAIVASNPSVSEQTGWPIGFWWSELTHPYREFVERGYHVDVYSPNGGKLEADNWSDPRDESRYSATDLISLGFICSPDHMKLVENSTPISQLQPAEYDALGPMCQQTRCLSGLSRRHSHHDDLRARPATG